MQKMISRILVKFSFIALGQCCRWGGRWDDTLVKTNTIHLFYDLLWSCKLIIEFEHLWKYVHILNVFFKLFDMNYFLIFGFDMRIFTECNFSARIFFITGCEKSKILLRSSGGNKWKCLCQPDQKFYTRAWGVNAARTLGCQGPSRLYLEILREWLFSAKHKEWNFIF